MEFSSQGKDLLALDIDDECKPMVAWVVRYHNALLVSMFSHALHHVPDQVEMETNGYMC
jgi:hypothetical protein